MASEPAAEGGSDITASETLASIVEAYNRMDMEMSRYIFLIVLPSFVFFAGTVAVAVFVELPISVRLPIPLLGGLVLFAAVAYPKLLVSQERVEMENQYHLMMTHMTVLSTTNIDRMEVFRTLAREEEYGAAAEEIGQIVHLVDTWNRSLDDACRRQAKEVPSDAMADFFDRLGYTIAAGQELEEFLLSELDVMLANYETLYESSLENIEVMKDLYMSMILSMTFALVFAIVLPILTGTNPTLTVAGVIVLFAIVQTGFYLVIRSMAPHDPVWYHPEDGAPGDRKLYTALGLGGVGTLLLTVFTAAGMFGIGPGLPALFPFLDSFKLPLYLCVPLTPLFFTGVVLRSEEKRITARDESFPPFIRALGATESAKQSTTSKVLETLRKKDFGALTPSVERLYRRLNMRLSPEGAWRSFSVDTRSYLIQKFSEMYLVGRRMGGDPKQLGELISKNMNAVNQLREQRRQSAVTLIGLLYGITAASSFAFFIGLQVVNVLADISADLSVENMDFGQIIYAGVYDIPLIKYLLLLVILYNALLSSMMIRAIDGGNPANGFIHFVSLTWLGCLTAISTTYLVTNLLAV